MATPTTIRTATALAPVALLTAMLAAGDGISIPIDPEIGFPFAECGTLDVGVDGATCPIFVAGNGTTWTIENTGDFQPGDHVCVNGTAVTHHCVTLCGDVTGCLFDNTISETVFVEFCGQIQPGPQSCLTINGDDGAGIIGNGDLHGAGLFDLVSISAAVVPGSPACFPIVTDTLDVLSVEACMEGDVNLDGGVSVDDVVRVILMWETDDYWADVDQSGVVAIDDLVRVVLAWTP